MSKKTEPLSEADGSVDQEAKMKSDVISNTEIDETSNASVDEESQVTLEQQLAELSDKNNQLNELYMRAKAESENIRRRSEKEVSNVRKFALESFAKELLSVKDSFNQATLSSKEIDLEQDAKSAFEQMLAGLDLTHKQFDGVMKKFGVVEVDAGAGVKFDPELHQAISMIESEDIESGHIIDVMQKGFVLNDRLLRPAMVVVAQ